MYYIGIWTDAKEWRIVKHLTTKEDAVILLKTIRSHNLKAAAFVVRDGKYRKLVNL